MGRSVGEEAKVIPPDIIGLIDRVLDNIKPNGQGLTRLA